MTQLSCREMGAKLSNYEIRAYRKRDGRVVLHLKTHILFEAKYSFNIEAYLKEIRCYLAFQGNAWLEFDSVGIDEGAIILAKKYSLYEVRSSLVTNLREIRTCMVKLRVVWMFNVHGAEYKGKIENEGIVRRMF